MRLGRMHLGPFRLSPVGRVVLGSLLLGVTAVALVAWAWSDRTHGPVPAPIPDALLSPVLLAVTVASELVAVRLRHGDEDEALTLLEAAVVADVLLLPAGHALLVAVGGLGLACALARRPLIKTLFNLGAHAFGTALLVSTVALLAPPASGLGVRTVAAIVVGNLLFGATNLVLLAWVLAAATGASAQETVDEQWRLSAIMSVGTCGLGATAVALAVSAPALLPFAFLPAAALTYAYRAAAQEARERVRSARLAALSQVLVGRLVADDLLSNFLGLLRETFGADSARVILEGDEERPGAVVLAHEYGVDVGELTASDAALLARTGDVAELVPEGLLPGWGRTLLSPLEAEGRRLGVLVLVAAPAGRRQADLGERDLDVLAPLLSALGVALRGAEHLSRLVEETGKLHAVVDHSSDGILVLDADGRVLVWNRAMASISGVSAELASGRSLRELLATSDGNGVLVDPIDAGWEQLSPESPQATVELALARPDGDQRWIRASHRRSGRQTRTDPGRRARLRRHEGAAGGAAQGGLHRHRVARAAHPRHADQGIRGPSPSPGGDVHAGPAAGDAGHGRRPGRAPRSPGRGPAARLPGVLAGVGGTDGPW
jgi:PAS domain S-box-containing protein